MKPVRHIVDTTLRDGEQSPGLVMTPRQKLDAARILDAAGIYQIEAGIPAVGSVEIDTISAIMDSRKNARISAWNRLRLEDLRLSVSCRPDILHISTPVSYVLIYTKLKKNKSWVIKNLSACVEFALERGFDVTVGFEDASRADITFMVTLAQLLREKGVGRIRFADTVGVLSPSGAFQAVKELIVATGIDVEFHAHNDLGMAVANTLTGAAAGAAFIDTTIRGIGERAGNCDYFKFVHAAADVYDLGISKFDAFVVEEKIASLLSL
ncbi:homocitrate synthase [Oscillospiraceae bacterium WX1]